MRSRSSLAGSKFPRRIGDPQIDQWRRSRRQICLICFSCENPRLFKRADPFCPRIVAAGDLCDRRREVRKADRRGAADVPRDYGATWSTNCEKRIPGIHCLVFGRDKKLNFNDANSVSESSFLTNRSQDQASNPMLGIADKLWRDLPTLCRHTNYNRVFE